MPIRVDSKGNITFEPDDIPVEVIPVPEKIIPGLESARTAEEWKADPDNLAAAPIPTAPIEIKELGTKVIETPMLSNYGDMTKEDLYILFYNREKPRAADATDESLARMQKEIKIMMEILRIRENAIRDEDFDRETRRSRKEKDARKLLDREYKPITKLQKSAAEELADQQRKAESAEDRRIKLLMAGGLSRDEAINALKKAK